MNLEDRKQQARLFEQQGEFADALELYEEALSELEGTPEIWRELPLYVKAGDLSLKMGDASGAISHYEKAARAYAAYGSSRSVIALCTKILRVNPGHTHAFLRLVRLMIERDHLAEARLVLAEYAERMKLPKAGAVLANMAGRSDEELKPLLELLLELGGRYEYARAQGRDEPHGVAAAAAEPEPEKDTALEDQTEPADSGSEGAEGTQGEEQLDQGFSQHTEEHDADERIAEPEPAAAIKPGEDTEVEQEPEQEPVETSTPPAAGPGESDVQWVDVSPPRSTSQPRASRKVLFREGEARKNKPKALWIGLGAVAVVVVGGLSLVLFGVIPLGGGGGGGGGAVSPLAEPVADAADSALLAGVNLDDSTSAEGAGPETDPGDTAATEIEQEPIASQVPRLTGAGESAAVGTPAETPPSRGVMVLDFDIESTAEFTANGRAGFRITQIMGTGERLTLSAVYYGDDIISAPGTERVTLAPLVGDTTTAIMHFNGYAVEARAVVSASVLEALLGRLIEVPPSN